MVVRAKTNFAGAISMHKGEVKEYSDDAVLHDLIQAGYVEEVAEKATKGGKNEGKRSTSK